MTKKILSFLTACFILLTTSLAQSGKQATDYLSVPGPIQFEKRSYNLNWSSHPAVNFYKQEYIVKGDLEDRYNTMILIDVVTNQDIKAIVSAKVAEIKKLKEGNPIVNYQIFDNAKNGEYMIDFLLSQNAADGKAGIVERNVYRYKTFNDKSGQKGVLLFGASTRSYGNDIDNFLVALKTNKSILINAVAKFSIPVITIRK